MNDVNVTLRTVVLGTQDSKTGWYGKTFTETTIEMLIFPKGSRQLALSMGLYPRYDTSGYCIATVEVGDEILDAFGNYYSVELVDAYQVGDTFVFNECSLTKQPLHADRPATSGTWAAINDPQYVNKLWLDTYLETFKATADGAADGTTIIDANLTQPDDYFNGKTVTMLTGTCATETCVVSDYDQSSGLITLVGAGFSAQIDKYDKYSIPMLLKDDGTTAASYITCFDNPDYPIPRVFIEKAVDLVFTVAEPNSEPLLNADKTTHSYRETVPIEVFVVNKTGITGANLKWQAEAELRRVAETYAFGSVRTVKATLPKPVYAGGTMIYSYQYMLNYVRDKT